MTTDPFTEAARKQARWEWDFNLSPMSSTPVEDLGQRMAEWARTHLAAQEPTDAEVLAALNASMDPHGPPEPHLGRYAPRDVDEMRRGIAAARAARRDEKKR